MLAVKYNFYQNKILENFAVNPYDIFNTSHFWNCRFEIT